MKLKNLVLGMALGLLPLGFQSCDDDDKDIIANPDLTSAFEAQFPDVDTRFVEWEWDGRRNAYEADFWEDRYEKTAWFSKDYAWLMTETDLNPPYKEVPAVVLDTASAAHPDYRIEDVDFIETPTNDYYVVEMERGERDIYLNIEEDGRIF